MSLALADIGLSQEELQDRVIETMADRLLKTLGCDEDGDEVMASSSLEKRLKQLVEKRIEAAVYATAEKHVLPRVDEIISTFTIRETNQWGESKGKKELTLTEFLVDKANFYMQEQVDYHGKSKSEHNGYDWRGCQTRITHAIHSMLHDNISEAMKKVIGDGNKEISKALHETCRLKLNEIAAKLQVNVSTGR